MSAATVIAYTDRDDYTNSVLKTARYIGYGGNCGSGKWQCDVVDRGLDFGGYHHVGEFASAALSSDGRVHIAYYDATGGDLKVAVEKATQTTTFNALANKLTTDAAFAVSATASSGLPVNFTSSTPAICTVTGNVVTLTGKTGICTIIANQPGNEYWHIAASVARSFAVSTPVNQKLPQTITLNPLPNKDIAAPPFQISATASSGLPVSFTSSTPPVCTVSGAMVALHDEGQCTIVAHQPGDTTYAPAPDVAQSFGVNFTAKQNQTISFAALPDKTTGAPDFMVFATASSGLTVTFTASGQCNININMVHLLGAGNCTITAHQAGNANYAAAPDVPRSFAISDPAKQSQTISFAPLPDKTLGDPPFQVSAIASSGLPVTFTASGTCSINGNTVALSG